MNEDGPRAATEDYIAGWRDAMALAVKCSLQNRDHLWRLMGELAPPFETHEQSMRRIYERRGAGPEPATLVHAIIRSMLESVDLYVVLAPQMANATPSPPQAAGQSFPGTDQTTWGAGVGRGRS